MNWKKLTLTYKVPGGAMYKVRYYRSGTAPGTPIQIRVLDHPGCRHVLGTYAHLLAQDYICIAEGREPTTIEQAKAIAMHWMQGFEVYRLTGEFPNGRARFDVKEVH